MKAYIVSLGCPKNLTDSEALMGSLAAAGHTITLNPRQAEIIIVNTCAFLRSAREESESIIKEMAHWKKKGKCKKLYVAGCLPKYLKNSNSRLELLSVDDYIDSIKLYGCKSPRIKATPPWTAYIKISEGCGNRCSYCLIPAIRGPLRTRKAADILEEAKGLAGRGVKEIIFIAQDTTAYPFFPGLLKETANINGIKWIRIMYAHPKHLNDKIIDMIAKEDNVLKYIDLPMQHASGRILKSMRRGYSKDDLVKLVKKLRKNVPGICIRTTFIVGFPGESEKDFQELHDFVKEMKFDRVGVFPYSREEGTPAAGMKDHVPEGVKTARVNKLMKMQAELSKDINKTFIGKVLKVIVEGHDNNYYLGRSFRDAPEIDGRIFVAKKGKVKAGDIINVKITGAKAYDLAGVMI